MRDNLRYKISDCEYRPSFRHCELSHGRRLEILKIHAILSLPLRRICQIELKQRIESLTEELQKINDALQYPLETDSYVKKLINAKHKITIVSNILQTTQERLNKVHQAVERSTAKRKTLLDNGSSYSSINAESGKEQPVEGAAAADKQQ